MLDAVSILYKATVGEPVEMGKNVVVIGGGDVAFDAGRTALRLGAEQVTINCIEDDVTMPASDEEVEEGLDEGISFNCSCMPDAIVLDKSGRACGVTFSSCSLGDPDARGWRPPVRLDGTEHDLGCDTVIFAIGQSMVDDFVQGAEGVQVERGQIVTDKQTLATGRAGVFAGGDAAASAPWTAIEAVAAGRRAARAIHNHLRGEELVPVWDEWMDEAKPEDEVLAKTEVMARMPMPHLPGRGPQGHLGRGQHRLHPGAGRRRGQALPRLRHLLRVLRVRARLRAGRPAARASATASSASMSAPSSWRPASTCTTPARRASTGTAATRTCSARSSTSACSARRGRPSAT